ncbi:hypothetical protein BVRB_6g155370 [Beta vulgaris subsp. vulgaris]|uniref:Uncharacterized protein n=1 Tax=Beta vulgaris subsp. vulgaris TaxID=3555 RepID=A0A0J8B8W7_BETVV|nr:hypothetical protein BVRB_6g155370 [Beta vulgaris subsp. vulgaris]
MKSLSLFTTDCDIFGWVFSEFFACTVLLGEARFVHIVVTRARSQALRLRDGRAANQFFLVPPKSAALCFPTTLKWQISGRLW